MVTTLYYKYIEGSLYDSLVVVDSDGKVCYASVGKNRSGMLNQMAKEFLPLKEFRLSSTIPKENHHISLTLSNFKQVMDDPRLIDKLNIPYRFVFGTELQHKIWRRLAAIPCGTVTNYSSLALELGKPNGSRLVGNCIGKNRIALLIPCHRVVGKSGKLTGYKWGLNVKIHLLNIELDDKYDKLIDAS
jgi:methylated-DNA-[protein]-cysteine S-methyltransferase